MKELDIIINEIDVKMEGNNLALEDFGGRRRFLIEVDPTELFKHERIFLSNNTCDGFLQMNFLKQETIDRIFYDFTGLLQLESYLKLTSENQSRRLVSEEDMQTPLYIVDQVLKIIRDAEDCMLFIQRFRLTKDCIFINPHTREVKIAYIPDSSIFMSTPKKLITFIDSLQKVFQDITIGNTLKNLQSTIITGNPGIEQIRNMIGKTQRDLRITYSLD